ncbi:MAG: Uma2 family endonuclease [Bryobacteraceae bacterium]|nr:Uma2 family endonuclease [Bryobacteraceae bacterium]
MAIDERVWRLPVDRYHAMIRSGALSPEDSVELLEGILVEKMSKNPAHRVATRKMGDALRAALPFGWSVDERAPVTTADSEPEPDLTVVRGATDDYRDRHPHAVDVPLVVEVADSSLRRDREIKQGIYARAGFTCYWLLDLNARALEVYREPGAQGYASKRVYAEESSVTLSLAAETVGPFPVSAFLPRP